MEHLEYEFGPWESAKTGGAGATVIAGVVGSGNLEVLIEHCASNGQMRVSVDTSIAGFAQTWQAVMADFAERQRFGNVQLTINDAGATPAVVSLRLSQAAEQWRLQA